MYAMKIPSDGFQQVETIYIQVYGVSHKRSNQNISKCHESRYTFFEDTIDMKFHWSDLNRNNCFGCNGETENIGPLREQLSNS